MYDLEVVIPCFNEASNIPNLVRELSTVSQQIPVSFVLVDNGSTDATREILGSVQLDGIRVLHLEVNHGYGGGILAGLRTCSAVTVGWMHADLQTPPGVLTGAPSRATSGEFLKGRRHGRGVVDQFFTAGMSVIESVIFGRVLWDINAQPTLFPREWFETLASPPTDFSLDLYVYLQAKRSRLDVTRFWVPFGKRFAGTSSWNTGMRSRMKFIRRTLRYSVELRRTLGEDLSPSTKQTN